MSLTRGSGTKVLENHWEDLDAPRSGLMLFELPPYKPEEPRGQVITDSHLIPFRFQASFQGKQKSSFLAVVILFSHTHCTVVESTPLARSLQDLCKRRRTGRSAVSGM